MKIKAEREEFWQIMYSLATNFYLKNNHLNIKQKFRTLNGYDENENGYHLGIWLINQRHKYKQGKLEKERIEKLEKIAICWEKPAQQQKDDNWEQVYNHLKEYVNTYHTLDIENNLTTPDGINIKIWLKNQKQKYKKGKLSKTRIEFLQSLGFKLDEKQKRMILKKHRDAWNKMYCLAANYKKHYGNLNIKQKFRTLNGYEEDQDGENLGAWLAYQKERYKNKTIPDYQIDKLNELKINWGNGKKYVTDEKFLSTYQLALNYFKHYGNLNIQPGFKTNDGITYNENGISLYLWVINQRYKYKNNKISEERINMLKNIFMIFDFESNKKQIQLICNNFGLNKYIKELQKMNMPSKELYIKATYIKENNIENDQIEDILFAHICTIIDFDAKLKNRKITNIRIKR